MLFMHAGVCILQSHTHPARRRNLPNGIECYAHPLVTRMLYRDPSSALVRYVCRMTSALVIVCALSIGIYLCIVTSNFWALSLLCGVVVLLLCAYCPRLLYSPNECHDPSEIVVVS